MNPLLIIADLRFQDILDILFLVVVAYHLYLWFRGTKALKAILGLLVLGIVFTVARTWGLFLTTWVFQILWQVLVILLIILFQSEIRQVLERVNPLKKIGFQKKRDVGGWIGVFSKAVFSLAGRRIGALIIIERLDRVDEWITGGQHLEGNPTVELLTSIFQKESPLHDGAVMIRDNSVTRVACFLPLSSAEGLPKEWGTRHRAALGLAERCDALVVVVSEERGTVSLARGNRMIPIEDQAMLNQEIVEILSPLRPPKRTSWEILRTFVTYHWRAKLGTLALVCFLWTMLAGQQDFEVHLSVPLAIRGLPVGMEIVDPLDPKVRIRIRGLRKDASTLDKESVHAEINLSEAVTGKRIFPITREHISLPNDRIYVVSIDPPMMTFVFKGGTGLQSPPP